MTITYRTTGVWGAGKGSNLLPAEVDGNFYELAERLEAVETYAPAPVAPTNVSISGTQITFSFSDGQNFTVTGPSAVFPTAITSGAAGFTFAFSNGTSFTAPTPIFTPSVRTITAFSHQIVLADANAYLRMIQSLNDLAFVTIPPDAALNLPIGTEVHLRQSFAGVMQIAGPTLNLPAGFLPETNREGAVVTIKKVAANTWDVFGLLAEGSA